MVLFMLDLSSVFNDDFGDGLALSTQQFLFRSDQTEDNGSVHIADIIILTQMRLVHFPQQHEQA